MTFFFVIVIALMLLTGYATGANALTSIVPLPDIQPDTVTSMYQSDGTLTGSPITNDPSTWPGSDKVWNICAAVAIAEGYNELGSVPYSLNNPGDLSPGDEDGQSVCGNPQAHSGSAIIVFCTAESGWTALYTKFTNIIAGRSSVYASSLTWAQVGKIYAGDSASWITNVTNYLGVDPSSTPAQYINS